jgi:hypothetical protein
MAMTESPEHLATRERQILWVSGLYPKVGIKPGSFYQHLINAFFAADRQNLARLKQAFPTTAIAYDRYMSGELATKYHFDEKEIDGEENRSSQPG